MLNAGGAQMHVNSRTHHIWRRSGGIKTFGGGIFFVVKNGVEEQMSGVKYIIRFQGTKYSSGPG